VVLACDEKQNDDGGGKIIIVVVISIDNIKETGFFENPLADNNSVGRIAPAETVENDHGGGAPAADDPPPEERMFHHKTSKTTLPTTSSNPLIHYLIMIKSFIIL
jgi:hypothetical protein